MEQHESVLAQNGLSGHLNLPAKLGYILRISDNNAGVVSSPNAPALFLMYKELNCE